MAGAGRLIKIIPSLFDTFYYRKIKSLFGSSIIGYWPLWELAGAVAADISGSGRNGAYTGVDLGYPGIGDGRKSPYFDGTHDYVNVYSAGLAGAFNGDEGTILVWGKVYDAGVWTDGSYRNLCMFYVDASNYVTIRKNNTNTLGWRYDAGGSLKTLTLTVTPLTQMCIGLTWSKSNDRMRGFFSGRQIGTDQASLGAWAGALSATTTGIGGYYFPVQYPWYGYLAHGVLLNREATPAEMTKAAQL